MKKYIAVFEVPDGYKPTDYLENADGWFTDEEGNRCTVGTKLEEAKEGEWIKDGVGLFKCSLCSRRICTEISNDKPYIDFPFCHCGAEMKGGAK